MTKTLNLDQWPYRFIFDDPSNEYLNYKHSDTLSTKWKIENKNNDDGELQYIQIFKDDIYKFKNELIPSGINGIHIYLGGSDNDTKDDEDETERSECKVEDKNITRDPSTIRSVITNIISNLPPQIRYLKFSLFQPCVLDAFPLFKVKDISVGSVTHLSISGISLTKDIHIPKSITHLTVNDIIKNSNIPSNVQHLHIKSKQRKPNLQAIIPSTITSLCCSELSNRFHIKDIGINQIIIKENFISISKAKELINSPNLKKLVYPAEVDERIFTYEEQLLPIFDGVFRVFDDDIEQPIPSTTKHLIWYSSQPIKPYQIPNGVKIITFGYSFNQSIQENCIPSSVEYIKFTGLNRSLSDIKFPSNLKRLYLGGQFNQFVYGIEELPNTLTHLQVYVHVNDRYHWINTIGNIPSHITHLKIISTCVDGDHDEINFLFILPSTIKYVDIANSTFPYVHMMDQQEYYKQPLVYPIKSTYTTLKHIEITTDVLFHENYQLPSSLTSLYINNTDKESDEDIESISFNESIIPPSVQILKCPNQLYVPLCNNFTYIEYSIQPHIKQIIFKSINGKPISSSNIPTAFDIGTTEFIPPVVDKIDKLFIKESKQEVSNQLKKQKLEPSYKLIHLDIRKLILDIGSIPVGYIPSSVEKLKIYPNNSLSVGSIPNGVKVLTLLDANHLNLQDNNMIPPSVEILKCYSEIDSYLIPSTIKVLKLQLNDSNLSIVSNNPIKSKHDQPEITPCNTYTHPTITSKSLFLQIWRNHFLKNMIFNFNYPTIFCPENVDQVIQAQQRFNNITLIFNYLKDLKKEMFPNNCKNIEGVILNLSPDEEEEIQFQLESILPHQIKRLKLNLDETDQDEAYEDLIIPNWITHLQLNKESIDISIPESVTHLSLFGFERIERDMIPSTVKHLVLDHVGLDQDSIPASVTSIYFTKFRMETIDSLPTTVQRIEYTIASYHAYDKIEYLSSRLHDYEVKKPQQPIKSTTKTLIWEHNQVIQEGDIPNSVTKIIFGHDFNQIILPNTIPHSVSEIYFGERFKQSFDNVCLPPSVTSISLWHYNSSNYESLSPTIKYINFTNYYGGFNDLNLPSTVSHVSVKMFVDVPSHIKHLKFSNADIDQYFTLTPSTHSIQIENGILFREDDTKSTTKQNNSTTTDLQCKPLGKDIQVHLKSSNFNQFIQPRSLISNIKSIDFGCDFNQILLKDSIPDSVTKLVMNNLFRQPLSLPRYLKVLELGYHFNQPITLPDTLEHITIGSLFTQPITVGFFPKNIRIIHLNNEFDEELEVGVFPDSVEEIHFDSFYDFEFEQGTLPSNLKVLSASYYENMFEFIPKSIQVLNLVTYSLGYTNDFSFSAKLLPQSLTKLTLSFDHPIHDLQYLPPSIKYLKLGRYFKGRIPKTVESLQLSHIGNAPLDYLFE